LLENELDEYGLFTDGQIVGHKSWNKRGKTNYLAEVEYIHLGRSYFIHLSGEGASRERIPAGTIVKVKYLARKPEVAEATTVDASTSQGPGWWAIIILWGAVFVLFTASWFLRAKHRAA
jgi:hypothetical protein